MQISVYSEFKLLTTDLMYLIIFPWAAGKQASSFLFKDITGCGFELLLLGFLCAGDTNLPIILFGS